MTTPNEDLEAEIISIWQANWTAAPTAYENVAFDPSNLNAVDISAGFVNGGPFVALSISTMGSPGQISTANNGTRRWRLQGLVTATGLVPTGYGKKPLRSLLDTAQAIFQGKEFLTGSGSRILFFNAVASQAGVSQKDPAWFAGALAIRFWFDFDA